MRGGVRPGAGRKRGSVTKKTSAIVEAAAETGELPLEFMLKVMRDETLPLEQRLDVAKSAAPFCHPRLSSLAVRSNAPTVTNNNILIELVAPEGHEFPGQNLDLVRIEPPR